MWWRRSRTRTLRPSSFAHRSAIVSPKKPDPTITRSRFTHHSYRGGRGSLTTRPRATVGDQASVGDPTQRFGDEPVATPHYDVAEILPARGDAESPEPVLQGELGAE